MCIENVEFPRRFCSKNLFGSGQFLSKMFILLSLSFPLLSTLSPLGSTVLLTQLHTKTLSFSCRSSSIVYVCVCVYLYPYLYLYRSVALSNFSKFPLSIFFFHFSLAVFLTYFICFFDKKKMYSIIIYNNNDIVHVHNHIQRAEEEEECLRHGTAWQTR